MSCSGFRKKTPVGTFHVHFTLDIILRPLSDGTAMSGNKGFKFQQVAITVAVMAHLEQNYNNCNRPPPTALFDECSYVNKNCTTHLKIVYILI